MHDSRLGCLLLFFAFSGFASAQDAISIVTAPRQAGAEIAKTTPAPQPQMPTSVTVPAVPAAPAQVANSSSNQETVKPTWETQSQARTYLLSVPAPRGQITDRNGNALAQTRVAWNLALNFPTPLVWPDNTVLTFARDWIRSAETLLGKSISLKDDFILNHYHNRGVLPMELLPSLTPEECERVKARGGKWLSLYPTYVRFYPNGSMAGHVIGYAGKAGRSLDAPIQNNDPLFPESQGREGLEQTFNTQLTGKAGQININFDASGKKTNEKMVIPPQPGANVVTALDENIQRLCEDALAKGCKRGAMVILDANTGDVLALASWPVLNPNAFVPSISPADYKAISEDPDIPLYPRAYRASYPPGSTFKTFVGMAALESGAIQPDDTFECPPSLEIGNLTFKNWKKTNSGSLNLVEALTQSCNTWFFQVGLKMGAGPICEWSEKIGFGEKTGLPLVGETSGRMPNDEYMKKTYGRKLIGGDVANLSIGQGDTQISPVQMAQAMAAVGNGGIVYQPRLVLQVQTFDNRVITGYDVRPKEILGLSETTIKTLREGLTDVVESGMGTAGKAAVPGIHVAGKTGTAQWGPKKKERTAAWFAGFAPATNPKYAFAALYEGEIGDNNVHGGSAAAPMVGKVLRELFKDEVKAKKSRKGKDKEKDKEKSSDEDEDVQAKQKAIERQAQDDE